MICSMCGNPIARADGFRVETDPPRVFFNGQLLAITPLQAHMFAKLVEHRRLPFRKLHISRRCLDVHMCQIRKVLPKGVTIRTVRSWGFELEVLPAGP